METVSLNSVYLLFHSHSPLYMKEVAYVQFLLTTLLGHVFCVLFGQCKSYHFKYYDSPITSMQLRKGFVYLFIWFFPQHFIKSTQLRFSKSEGREGNRPKF